MDWLKFFKRETRNSASIAKDRLMVAVALQRAAGGGGPPYLGKLREELLGVVRRYIQVPDEAVVFKLQRDEGLEVIELNITLPDRIAPTMG
jgi:cell division topological specificity factor